MKLFRIHSILSVLVIILLVACSCDKEDDTLVTTDSLHAITFSSCMSDDADGNNPSTRANTPQPLHETGVTDFTVYGIKGNTTNGTFAKDEGVVYSNYKVRWADNSANTTATNSSGWEYNGVDSSDQTIKYWDYSQDTYYFWAIARAANGQFAEQSAPQVADGYATFDAQGRVATYTKNVSATENLTEANAFYYSKICKVNKANYDNPVKLEFIPCLSRVRIAFYEAIPGYVVSAFTITDAKLTCLKSGTAVLTYDYTDDQITSAITPTETASEQLPLGAIHYMPLTKESADADLTEGCLSTLENTENTYLGRTSTTASFMQGGGAAKGYYINLLPFENRSEDFTITCDYTVTNTRTGVTRKVKDAKATVPMSYLNWRPGSAYTYLFKISDLTAVISLIEVTEVAIMQWDVQSNTDHPLYNW